MNSGSLPRLADALARQPREAGDPAHPTRGGGVRTPLILASVLPLARKDSKPHNPIQDRTDQSSRGLPEPVGIHPNFALGLSNEVGPPQNSHRNPESGGATR